MCIKYKIDEKEIDYLPSGSEDQMKVKPVYKTFSGWKTSTKGIRNLKDLPDKAKIYIKAIESFTETKITKLYHKKSHQETSFLLPQGFFPYLLLANN